MTNRQRRLDNSPVSEETSSSSFTAKMNVEQLLGIAMMIIMTILLWGDWIILAFLYIPFVGILAVIHGLKWWQAAKESTE